MRTGRSLTVCRGLLPGGGGVPEGGVCVLGGVGCVPRGCAIGVGVWGGVCARGGCARGWWWWYPSMHWGRRLPPVNRMTNSSKNITLATTSLRPVIVYWSLKLRACIPWIQDHLKLLNIRHKILLTPNSVTTSSHFKQIKFFCNRKPLPLTAMWAILLGPENGTLGVSVCDNIMNSYYDCAMTESSLGLLCRFPQWDTLWCLCREIVNAGRSSCQTL